MAVVNVNFPSNLAQVSSASDLRLIPSSLLPNGSLYAVIALDGIFTYATSSLAVDDGVDILRPSDRSVLQAGRWKRFSGGGSGTPSPVLNLNALTENVRIDMGAENAFEYALRVTSVADNSNNDGVLVTSTMAGGLASGYPLHGIVYVEADVVNAGGVGGAVDGPGIGNGMVGNRRGDGRGSGALFSRVGSGNGSGVFGNFTSTGTGAGVTALKQNNDGSLTPGAPHGTGPGLEVINQSDQGPAIDSTTTANNASLVSNVFRRANVAAGVVVDIPTQLGGVRTSEFVSLRVIHNPATLSTGTAGVKGADFILGETITGSVETTAFNATNLSSGNVSGYGASINSIGDNDTNTAARFAASGGGVNYSIDCAEGPALFRDGFRTLDTPVYADNAAAVTAGLTIGQTYRTSTGALMVVFSV